MNFSALDAKQQASLQRFSLFCQAINSREFSFARDKSVGQSSKQLRFAEGAVLGRILHVRLRQEEGLNSKRLIVANEFIRESFHV
jgi:hypothetical protein